MKKLLIAASAAIIGVIPAFAQTQVVDSASVAVGTVLGNYINESLQNVERLGVKVDRDVFVKTVGKVIAGESTGMTMEEADRVVTTAIDANRPAAAPSNVSVESQQAFIDAEAAKEGAIVTPAGVVLQVITEGEGEFPGAQDVVKVFYTGRLADGTIFDQTQSQPAVFPLNHVVPGFSDGIQHMRPGGKYRIIFPATLGYGSEGVPNVIPGNSALDFTIELVGVEHPSIDK